LRRHVPRLPVWRAAAWRHGSRRRPHRHAPVQRDQPARDLAVPHEPAGARRADGRAVRAIDETTARIAYSPQSAAEMSRGGAMEAPRIAVVMPRGMSFGPERASSIDLCAHDFITHSRYRASTTVHADEVARPYAGL